MHESRDASICVTASQVLPTAPAPLPPALNLAEPVANASTVVNASNASTVAASGGGAGAQLQTQTQTQQGLAMVGLWFWVFGHET